MPSIDRPLSGDVLVFRLEDEAAIMRDSGRRESGPTSRTLLKSDALSVTMISLHASGEIREHHAPGPITVHVLSGSITLEAAGREHHLVSGDLASLAAGVPHSVRTSEDATFLLTISHKTPSS